MDRSPLAALVFAGLSFARLDSPHVTSEQVLSDQQHDIYRCLDSMGEPSISFMAYKDIHSLGTIVLEIRQRRSLKGLVERDVNDFKTDVSLATVTKIGPFLLQDGP